jgi:type VI secretion system protein ImpH
MENIRGTVADLARKLRGGISAPDFWALIRRLEQNNSANPRFGFAKRPSQENVRFGQVPFLHFPPTDIAEIREGDKAGVDAGIFTYFFGLFGVNGPMPLEFTNYVLQRSHNYRDHAWRRFLDIIHHRFLVLYYRAFAANQQSISFDRKSEDPISAMVKSLAGFSPEFVFNDERERLALVYTRHFGASIKTRWALEDMLRRLFRFPLRVRDFVTASYDIPPDSRAVLGKTTRLGVNTQIGRTYLSATHKFEIEIGPVSFITYQKFISGMTGLELLIDTVNLYLDRPLDYSVVFRLKSFTIPLARIGFDWEEDGSDAAQLGYTCWLGSLDSEEAELRIDAGRLSRERHRNSFKGEVKR